MKYNKEMERILATGTYIMKYNKEMERIKATATYIMKYNKELWDTKKELITQDKSLLNPNILAAWCRRPLIFQTMNSVRLNSQRFTLSGCKDVGLES